MHHLTSRGPLLAAEEFAVAEELAELLECAAFADAYAQDFMIHRLLNAQLQPGVAAPPALPKGLSGPATRNYMVQLRAWLDDVRRLLKSTSEGARALALAAAAHTHAPHVAGVPSMGPVQWLRYLINLDESAKMLAFYCAAIANATPDDNGRRSR